MSDLKQHHVELCCFLHLHYSTTVTNTSYCHKSKSKALYQFIRCKVTCKLQTKLGVSSSMPTRRTTPVLFTAPPQKHRNATEKGLATTKSKLWHFTVHTWIFIASLKTLPVKSVSVLGDSGYWWGISLLLLLLHLSSLLQLRDLFLIRFCVCVCSNTFVVLPQ